MRLGPTKVRSQELYGDVQMGTGAKTVGQERAEVEQGITSTFYDRVTGGGLACYATTRTPPKFLKEWKFYHT